MKRFVMGFICAALIFGGTSVLADSISFVGKTIDSEIPVYYNEEPLVAKAIAVEGMSYLPVRTVGNTLGAKIEYRDGAIFMEKTDDYEAIKQQVMNDIKLEMQKEEIRKEITKLQTAIENGRKQISELEIDIARNEGAVKDTLVQLKATVETIIQQQEAKIKELEAQLAELEGQEDGENQDQE